MAIWDWLHSTWQGWFPESPDRTKVPSKGRWLGADDPEVAEDQQRYDREAAEQARRDELSEHRLSDLMKHFNGNLAAALEAKMLTYGEPADQLEVIADGMMRG